MTTDDGRADRLRSNEAQDEPYDATDDFSRSIDACYAAVREHVAAGGKGMGAEMRRKERFEHLVRAFVLATGGQPMRGRIRNRLADGREQIAEVSRSKRRCAWGADDDRRAPSRSCSRCDHARRRCRFRRAGRLVLEATMMKRSSISWRWIHVFAVDGDEADATGIAGIKQPEAADVTFELEQRK